MKRILSILLCFVLLCCTAVISSAEEINRESLESTVGFLEFLGILEDYDIEMIQDGKPVTRANFCSRFADFMGVGDEEIDTLYYHDVPRDHWAFNDIGVLTARGIVSGVGEGYFEPDEPMERAAAIKMFVSVLGLDVHAKTLGGYPAGYNKVANTVGLLDGLRATNELMETDMLYMFENALVCKTGSYDMKGGELAYVIDEERTMLSDLYDMYIETGVVTAAKGVDIYGDSEYEDEFVIIDGVKYITETDMFEYLGETVEFVYYKKDGSSDEPIVKYIKKRDSSDVAYINFDTDCSFDENSMTITSYQNNDKGKEYKLSGGIMMVYNGVFYEGNVKEILKGERYEIKLIENSSEAGYDTAIVKEYENYVVNGIDSVNKVIYDKVTQGKKVSLNAAEYDSLRIYSGLTEKEFETISVDNVISVYRAKDGSRLDAYITATAISGVVESVNTEKKKIVINGTDYYFKGNSNYAYQAGNSVTIYLDKDGLIADLRLGITTMQPGFFIGFTYEDFSNKAQVKLLKADGQTDVLNFSKKVNIDGTDYKEYANAGDAIGENPQLILYQLNKDNEIITIDTLKSGAKIAEDELIKTQSYDDYNCYNLTSNKFDSGFYIDDTTVLFAVPKDLTKENINEKIDNLFTVKKTDLIGRENYETEAYSKKSQKVGAEEIVLLMGFEQKMNNYSTLSVLVESIDDKLNEEGDIVECIRGYQGAAEVELLCDSEYSPRAAIPKIKGGDVISVIINKEGNVEGTVNEYNYSYGSEIEAWPGKTEYANRRVVAGYAESKNGDYIRVKNNNLDEVFKIGAAPVLIYDASAPKNHIQVGTIDDVVTSEMINGQGNNVVIQDQQLNTKLLIIYK